MTLLSSKLTLYPANWLYNAGVVGFLRVLDAMGEDVEGMLREDGGVEVDRNVFDKIDVQSLYFGENKVASIVGNSTLYRNYLQKRWKPDFEVFVRNLKHVQERGRCDICGRGFYIPQGILQNLEKSSQNLQKFINGIRKFDVRLNNILAPSLGEFPNGFWDNKNSSVVCDLCGYLLIHHHLALIDLPGRYEIFINAPSFKVMWYLNRYAREIYGREEVKRVRHLFGMSVIKIALRYNRELSRWTAMNIEVVIKHGKEVSFFSVPYRVVKLLTDRKVASVLTEIKELSVLDKILDQKFEDLINIGEKILRLGFKVVNGQRLSKNEREFINTFIKLDSNRRDLVAFAQKIFKLHAAISDVLKEEVEYDRCANL